MQTPTKIWTTWNGQKVPLELMTTKHLKTSYRRCKEIVVASEILAELTLNKKFSMCNLSRLDLEDIIVSTLKVEDAEKWVSIFELELDKRKLKHPVLNRDNLYKVYNRRMESKKYLKEQFQKY